MESELKPCPFCGSDGQLNDHVLRTSSGHYTANVQCSFCDNVAIDQVYAKSRQEALGGAALVWNTRAKPTPGPATRAVLDQIAAKIREAKALKKQNGGPMSVGVVYMVVRVDAPAFLAEREED